MKKIVMYSSNSKRRSKGSNCVVFPKWSRLWNDLADAHSDVEIYLVVQLNGRYFLDLFNGELCSVPEKIHLVQMDMEDKLDEFVEKITELKPDVAIAMPGPVSGIDWNGLRDAAIAEELEQKGIHTICYPLRTAEICFDKWLTHCFLEENGFNVAKAVYCHHELFTAGKNDTQSTGNVYQEMVLHKVKKLPFPVIIKGTTGSASTGVYVAKDFEDARTYLLSDKNCEDLIIEEMLKGQLCGTEIHGVKGNYNVLPPFMIFTTDNAAVTDPLGLTTLKFGPMRSDKFYAKELVEELTRLAELMELNGNNNLDLMLCGDKWYIIEINARWSGLTTLTSCSEGRRPYEIYLQEYTGPDKDYSDFDKLKIACSFKMSDITGDELEKVAGEEYVNSLIQYEVIRPDMTRFNFTDVIIGGFENYEDMAECLKTLQGKYPGAIAAEIVDAIYKKLPEL